MRYLGGHLGVAVSALLDGQLDPSSTERAWAHVHGCPTCCRQVEREGWVKTQLAAMTGDSGRPPEQLLGSLYDLGDHQRRDAVSAEASWAAVGEIERHGRGRRRAGIALVGAGSVSVAVLGFASLTGSTLGIGGAPSSAPTRLPTTIVAPVAPVARTHGRLPLDGQSETPHGAPGRGSSRDR